jgi:quercetin dioxygenase-like cupin family protein
MIRLNPRTAARSAVAPRPNRPATATIYDTADARLVVFRIAAGQAVASHRSPSTVTLQVLAGTGFISHEGREQLCSEGDVVAFTPGEIHGMRAQDDELLLLATIAPRPSSGHDTTLATLAQHPKG